MISAAPVMMLPVDLRPNATECDRIEIRTSLVVSLANPAEKEHFVVHRQAEKNREQEDREPGFDGLHLLESEDLVPDAFLENEHEQSVRSADRQKV